MDIGSGRRRHMTQRLQSARSAVSCGESDHGQSSNDRLQPTFLPPLRTGRSAAEPESRQSAAGVVHACGSVTTGVTRARITRSEEHTSELPPLMRISYAVFCL